MEYLLCYVKEEGIINLIEEYKEIFEKLELTEKIENEYKKLKDMQNIQYNKQKIIKKCCNKEKSSDGYYQYTKIITQQINTGILNIRENIIKFEIERYTRYPNELNEEEDLNSSLPRVN